MAQHEPIGRRGDVGSSEIPDKLYFRIGEVARLCDVPAYVLRFWESEFPQLKPHKGGTGQRLYRRRDVEMALRIRSLLYDEGYTIPGARQVFKVEQRQKEPQLALGIESGAAPRDAEQLRRLRRELREIQSILSRPPGTAPGVPHPIRSRRPLMTQGAIPGPVVARATGPLQDQKLHPLNKADKRSKLFEALPQPGLAHDSPDGGSDATHG